MGLCLVPLAQALRCTEEESVREERGLQGLWSGNLSGALIDVLQDDGRCSGRNIQMHEMREAQQTRKNNLEGAGALGGWENNRSAVLL